MITVSKHMVSSCHWDTSFDAKEHAMEMQHMLSNWCRHQLANELDEVFEAVCPEDKTLKIKQLEIDLGPVYYDSFIEDLSVRLKNALRQKLIDILNYPSKASNTLEIIPEKTSLLKTLSHFLKNGMLPWNFSTTSRSMNELLTQQLEENKQETTQMLWEVGIHESVRKRIAWQVSSTNFKKIISVLEPSNHETIHNFSNEFIKIQRRETIVKSGSNDFERSIWFWVLNYLFVDRGTIFNREAFVRSNLLQMAHHFNMEYSVLFELVEEAVTKIEESVHISAEFILILKVLSKELRQNPFNTNVTKKQELAHWEQLGTYFQYPDRLKNKKEQDYFEELIVNLELRDRKRLKSMMAGLSTQESYWKSMVTNTTQLAKETFFNVLLAEKASAFLNQLKFLKVYSKQNTKIDADTIWKHSIIYVIKNNAQANIEDGFLNDFIKTFKLYNISNSLTLNIPKTLENTKAYQALKQKQLAFSNKGTAEVSEAYFKGIWEAYMKLAQANSIDSHLEIKLSEIILQWFEKQPLKAWKVITRNQDRQVAAQTLHKLLDEKAAYKLTKAVFSEKHRQLIDLEINIFEVLTSLHINHRFLFWSTSIELLLQKPNISLEALVLQLGRKLSFDLHSVKASLGSSTIFSTLLEETFATKRSQLSVIELKTIQAKIDVYEKADALSKAAILVTSKSSRIFVQQVLSEIKDTTRIEKLTTTGHEIINYLLPNAIVVWGEVYQKYTRNAVATHSRASKMKQDLIAVFWNCLLKGEMHSGSKNKFITLFEKEFKSAYPKYANENSIAEATSFLSNKMPQGVSPTIEIDEIVELETLIRENNKNSAEFQKLVLRALEKFPKRFYALFKEIALATWCEETLVLDQFLGLIIETSNEANKRYGLSLLSLFNIVQQVGNTETKKQLKKQFWNFLWEGIKTPNTLKESLQYLVKEVLSVLAKQPQMNGGYLVHKIKEGNIVVPEVLKNTLILENTVFELIDSKSSGSDELQAIGLEELPFGKLEELCHSLLISNHFPTWFQVQYKEWSKAAILAAIIDHKPLVLLSVLRKESKYSTSRFLRATRKLSISQLVRTLERLYPDRNRHFRLLEKFIAVTAQVQLKGLPKGVLVDLVLLKTIKAWVNTDWSSVSTVQLWQELIWELCAKQNIPVDDFFEAIEPLNAQLPIPFQISFAALSKEKIQSKIEIKSMEEKPKPNKVPKLLKSEYASMLQKGVSVPNAGMVLLNSYYGMLLQRLELVKSNAFVNPEAQIRAVHYLQFVVTGQQQTEEGLLVLNKILCGMDLVTPISNGIEVSKEEEDLIGGLINAAMGYWDAIGKSSINGFRGNWLVREGILKEEEDRWTLTIEKRPYDILLMKSPFSFSIIKYPWMSKALHVTWAY